MDFDYGTTLTRALKITWKHKTLWVVMMLPMLLSFFIFPLLFGSLFFLDESAPEGTGLIFAMILVIFIIILSIAIIVLSVTAMSSTTLGIVRIERGEGSLNVMDLLRDSLPYFGRSLGAMLIVQLTIGLVITIFFLIVFVLTLVTMGIASICLQPIMILLTPVTFLVLAVMEAAQTAIIAEDLGGIDAIKRAIQVVRAHIWKYLILTLVIYFGTMILTSFVIFPVMLPMFFIPLLMESGVNMSDQMMMVFPIAFMCFFFPVMALVSGITQTFMKASLDLAYLRLIRVSENEVIHFQEKS